MKTFVTFEKASLSRGYGEATIWKSPLHLVMIAAAFLSVTLGQEGIISAGQQFAVSNLSRWYSQSCWRQ
jgi:hypothetical protein